MSRKWGKQKDWPTIATRIAPEKKELLLQKFPNDGDLSKLLRALIDRYLAGRIIGVQLDS